MVAQEVLEFIERRFKKDCDWSGAVAFSDEYVSKHTMKWSDLRYRDPIWSNRIVRDVIL